ncbi:MAG: hypothetical protein JWR19_2410 [Pedosphaera sp.]|jgi:uncharacterized membrane protein|nr:hypothetical protein [Pedosphaera sp.]
METTASIRKHPIHPILVGMPIGLWVFSLICDLVYFFSWGGSEWKQVALYTLVGGILTALLAAIPGIIDLMSITDRRLKRIGVTHMIINLVVVLLYVINFADRRAHTEQTLTPLILSIVGVALLGVSGWLGGELVHVYGVSVAGEGNAGEGTRKT